MPRLMLCLGCMAYSLYKGILRPGCLHSDISLVAGSLEPTYIRPVCIESSSIEDKTVLTYFEIRKCGVPRIAAFNLIFSYVLPLLSVYVTCDMKLCYVVFFIVAQSRNSATVCNLKEGWLSGAEEDIWAWEGGINRKEYRIEY